MAAHAERLETEKSFQTPAEGSDHSRGLKEELLIHGGTPGNAARCCWDGVGGGSVKGSCAGRSVSRCRGHAAAPSNSRIYPFPPRQKVKSTYLSVSRSARLSLSFSRQLYLTLGHMCSLCPGGSKHHKTHLRCMLRQTCLP